MSRTPTADAFGQPLDHALPAGEQTLAGDPHAGVQELGTIAGADIGIWEMTPGTVTDVEAEEVFVVLTGRATVEFEGGERLELTPGLVVTLADGERTTWTVHETLRKVYVTPA